MSEERRSPHTESDESGLLLSVDPISERSLDFTALSDDNDATDADAEDTVGDTDETDDTDATDIVTADDADGTD